MSLSSAASLLATLRRQIAFVWKALETGSFFDLADHWAYRTPWKLSWRKLRGHDFDKSSFIYFVEANGMHTRVSLVLPKIAVDFPELQSMDMILDLRDQGGTLRKRWKLDRYPVDQPLVLDSRDMPEPLKFAGPFEGSLCIRQKLRIDEKIIRKRQGLFGSSSNFFDYFSDAGTISTTHDYSGWLPDQTFNDGYLGMIPAYADDQKETFILVHGSAPGIHSRDLRVDIYDADGRKRSVRLPAIPPFGVRRILLSELLPDVRSFLGGRMGQVVVRGVFRQLLRRLAYGMAYQGTAEFTIDHCFYSRIEKRRSIPAAHLERFPKGYFDPYLILEDDDVSTAAILFHDLSEGPAKKVDLLVYDEQGGLVLKLSPCVELRGNGSARICVRNLLKEKGIRWPFIGHGEVLFHREAAAQRYSCHLDLTAEYSSAGRTAHVVLGAALWNGEQVIRQNTDTSGFRVLVNEDNETFLAMSNCSYLYDFKLEAQCELELLLPSGGSRRAEVSLKPHASLYVSAEELFPGIREDLRSTGGLGLIRIRYQNCAYTANLFYHVDRRTGRFSCEHSFDLPHSQSAPPVLVTQDSATP